MTTDKEKIKTAVIRVLSSQVGIWITYGVLNRMLHVFTGQQVRKGVLNRAIYELVRDKDIQRKKRHTCSWTGPFGDIYRIHEISYRIPDNNPKVIHEDTPDMFRRIEEFAK